MGEGSEKSAIGVRADRRMILGAIAAGAAVAATSAKAISLPGIGGGGGEGPEAATQYGRVGGDLEEGINVFKGIPYGAPTGGGARFMPAQPPRNWGGVRACRKFGDQCPQETSPAVPA